MKKTIYMLPALALLMFAACSSEDAVTKDNTAQLNETSENAIGFDAYLNRTVTRAGAPGILTTSTSDATHVSLQDPTVGFGVFGYYANGDLYSENATPNFMYNQWVKYNDGTTQWTYEPVKYWPNEFGSSAISTGVDRVTFFAYAPYVGVDPTTGQLTSTYTGDQTTTGITSLTRNGKTGDPYVRYVGAFNPANCVDLCYGVAAADYKSSIGASDGANSINKGEPYLNVAKPEINSKIYFDFKHALAKLTVQIDADVDVVSHDGGAADEVDGKTRIWVRSITFDGIAQRGYLNLNSGMWYEVMDNNKISHASVTIHDGRRDGAEATADDSYESPTGFNEDLIQKRAYTTTSAADPTTGVTKYTAFNITEPGVTKTYRNLFGGSGSLLVIPANEQLKVTIVYDVETADATLPTYLSDGVTKGSTIENKITKYITLGGTALKLESGNAYNLNLHLGMNSVKFDAKVSDWEDNANADNTWLPDNAKVIAANSPATTINVPAEGGTYTYKITGLTASSTKTFDPVSLPTGWEWTLDETASSGIMTITVPANTTVLDKTQTVTLTESGDATTNTAITINQAAGPLGLKIEEAAQKMSGDNDIVLSAGTGVTIDWSADVATPNNDASSSIIVKKNGTTLTYKASPSADGDFNWNATDHKIELYTAAKAGEVYTITVKAGDAEAEPVSFTVLKKDATISGFALSANTVGVGGTLTVTTAPTPDPSDASSETGWSISYSSSDTNKATVDESTGVVTGVAAGECDITVTVTDTENYHFAAPTLTVHITVTNP